MSSRKIKKEVLSLLAQPDIEKIFLQLKQYPPEDLINPLFLAICRADERLRWHAISAFGQVVPQIAQKEMESARMVMRRFIWSLNDESGGIGWGAPESMGEIMYHHERLADEYLHMLVSYIREDGPELFQDGNFLELPQIQRGLLWALGRVAGRQKARMIEMEVGQDLIKYLDSDDPVIVAMTLWALGQLGDKKIDARHIKQFFNDSRETNFYRDGQFEIKSIAQFASKVSYA